MPRGKGAGSFNFYHPNKFRGYLLTKGYEPPTKFASVLGMSEQTFGMKIRGHTAWKFTELARIKYKLRMNDHDFCEIFFDTTEADIIR